MFVNWFNMQKRKCGGIENLGIQNIFTPLKNIEKATNTEFKNFITSDMKNIGVLFNWEFILNFLEDNLDCNYLNKDVKFTYFYDSEADRNALDNNFLLYKYRKEFDFEIEFVNITAFTEKNKDVKVIEKAMAGKHFDIVFSNPPYNGNIDLKILQIMFNHSDKIIFIHPSTFLLDKKFKTKIYNDVRNTNYLEKAILVWGNMLFDIWLFCPLTISVWNKKHDSNIVEVIDTAITNSKYTCSVNDISVHGEYFQKIKHFLNCENNLQNNITDENELTDYSVKFALIRGHANVKNNISGYNEDFFTIAAINDELNKCDHTFRLSESAKSHTNNGKNFPLFTFPSEAERENFLSYCKTKIVRFLLSLVKMNANMYAGELEVIPWMDFTQEWNDKKLCEEFGIDEELWQYIDKFIPDYYEDYDDGFTTKAKQVISRHHGVEPNDEMKTLCPAEVIDHLMRTTITCKSKFVSKGFTRNGYSYIAFKENNNDGDDTTFAWRVIRRAKRK